MKHTEARNPKTIHIDEMSTEEMLRVFHEENHCAVRAVEEQSEAIAQAVDLISDAMLRGGRLIYIGAGTSGRLGVLDAAECPPTFGVSPDRVIGIIAGGEKCLMRASENEEDNEENGRRDVAARSLTGEDVVVGISASGDAAYVLGAMRYAKSVGCGTIGVSCNRGSALDHEGDISICTDTGAEVITGSTRLKAGTAQKLILNILSTCAMVKTGKVYENLMINLKPTNQKLRRRMISIVEELTHSDPADAEELLDKHVWDIRAAVDAYRAEKA